jgi:biopolymer transport protein ExbD
MRFSQRRPRAAVEFFDLTPMIDVVMQLIIFFMFSSQFAQVLRSQIDLPEEPGEKQAAEDDEGALIIDVQADGSLLVAGESVDHKRLLEMISAELAEAGAQPSGIRVLVRADRTAPARYINVIAEDLARLGVRGWRLGTSRPPDAPTGGPR